MPYFCSKYKCYLKPVGRILVFRVSVEVGYKLFRYATGKELNICV